MNLYEKLLEIKKKVPYLKDDASGYGFQYASPEKVLGAINPLLNELKVIILPSVTNVCTERVKDAKGKEETLYNVSMNFRIIDCEDAEKCITLGWHGAGCNGDEQGYGSALTYGLRYFLLDIFQIPTGKDDPDAKERKPVQAISPAHPVQSQVCKMANFQLKAMIESKKITLSDISNAKLEIYKRNVPFQYMPDNMIQAVLTELNKVVTK